MSCGYGCTSGISRTVNRFRDVTLLCLAWTAGTKSWTSAYCGGDWDDLSPDNARITVYESHGTKACVDLGYMNVRGTIRDVGVALRLKRFQCSTPRACKDQPEAKDWFGPLACHRRSHIQRTFTAFLSRLSARWRRITTSFDLCLAFRRYI